MEKKIEKVLRFVELSKKFSKSELDIVPREKGEKDTAAWGDANHTVAIGYPASLEMNVRVEGRELYIDKDGTVMAKDLKPVNRIDTIMAIAEGKAALLKEYWEYQTLQTELTEYFQALKKINE